MGRVSGAARRKIDLAWIGFGVGNELRNGLGGKGRINHHCKRNAEEARDWRDVADEIEIEIVVECSADRVRGNHQEERIAVWRCTHDRLGGDISGSARPVLDNKLLAKSLR